MDGDEPFVATDEVGPEEDRRNQQIQRLVEVYMGVMQECVANHPSWRIEPVNFLDLDVIGPHGFGHGLLTVTVDIEEVPESFVLEVKLDNLPLNRAFELGVFHPLYQDVLVAFGNMGDRELFSDVIGELAENLGHFRDMGRVYDFADVPLPERGRGGASGYDNDDTDTDEEDEDDD